MLVQGLFEMFEVEPRSAAALSADGRKTILCDDNFTSAHPTILASFITDKSEKSQKTHQNVKSCRVSFNRPR